MATISENHQYKKGRALFNEGKSYEQASIIASTYKIKSQSLIMAGWHDADMREGNSFNEH